MEPVAYATHRWVMHGVGWGWHASHHRARTTTFERNDLYPATFAGLATLTMAAAATRRWSTVMAAGVGVTAYGAAYGVVHEIYAHRRMPRLRMRSAPLEALGRRHLRHHQRGGEPFGMLAPLVVDAVAPAAALGRTRSPAPGDPLVEMGAFGADGGVVTVAGQHQGVGSEGEQPTVN